jgi:hypothetical protein
MTAPLRSLRSRHVLPLALLFGVVHASTISAQDRTSGDGEALRLLDAVRTRMEAQDRTLQSFQATARERMSVALRTRVREHLVYRREMAARLDWSRTGSPRIQMLGARDYRAVPGSAVRVLDDVEAEALDLVFTPGSQHRSIGFGSFRLGDHPLSTSAVGRYRFDLGDTLDLRLASGHVLRLIEIRIEPTAAVFPAVSGSLWIDGASHTVVREVYSPRVDPATRSPGIAFIGDIEVSVDRIVIEHGLWELRWWLPRVLTFEGTAQVGRLASGTFRYERMYGDYDVHGTPAGAAPLALVADTMTRRWLVELPPTAATLLYSDELPPSIFSPETPAAAALRALRDAPWPSRTSPPPQPARSYRHIAPLDLMRYNRVEGISVGARAGVLRHGGSAEVAGRVATAGWNPGLVARLLIDRGAATVGVEAFHQIKAMELHTGTLAGIGSLNALLLGHDDADYYRATGAAIEYAHGGVGSSVRVRLAARREVRLDALADWTLPRLLGGPRELRPNIAASPATLVGPAIMLMVNGGSSEVGRWHARLHGDAATGTHEFARAALLLRAGSRDHALLAVTGEMAGGAAWGDVPPQHEWLLGGAASLRGYPGGTLAGSGFAIARLDVSLGTPATRVHLFTDVGTTRGSATPARAGRREDVGVGIGLLDSAVRIDVAHALRAPRGWRVALGGTGTL